MANQNCTTKMHSAMLIPATMYRGGTFDPTNEAAALLFMLLHEHHIDGTQQIKERILKHIQSIITPGCEPPIDAYKYHSFLFLTASLALAKRTDSIWCELDTEQKQRIDCLMRAFAYIANFITNDANDYKTGIGLMGCVYKKWNPNYRLSLVSPMIFCVSYFGGIDHINEILLNFDYDAEIALFESYGFTNLFDRWSTLGVCDNDGQYYAGAEELLMDGGEARIYDRKNHNAVAAGTGVGVRVEYLYEGTNELPKIIESLILHCYSGGAVTSRTDVNVDGIYDAYILDGSLSPYEGQAGMMKEFNSGDAHGMRNHAGYCQKDFCLALGLLAACRELGIYDITTNTELFDMVCVGNGDLIYKLEHGYHSYAMGFGTTTRETEQYGYSLWKTYWYEHFAPEDATDDENGEANVDEVWDSMAAAYNEGVNEA